LLMVTMDDLWWSLGPMLPFVSKLALENLLSETQKRKLLL